jgi:hypothetical protein
MLSRIYGIRCSPVYIGYERKDTNRTIEMLYRIYGACAGDEGIHAPALRVVSRYERKDTNRPIASKFNSFFH